MQTTRLIVLLSITLLLSSVIDARRPIIQSTEDDFDEDEIEAREMEYQEEQDDFREDELPPIPDSQESFEDRENQEEDQEED